MLGSVQGAFESNYPPLLKPRVYLEKLCMLTNPFNTCPYGQGARLKKYHQWLYSSGWDSARFNQARTIIVIGRDASLDASWVG